MMEKKHKILEKTCLLFLNVWWLGVFTIILVFLLYAYARTVIIFKFDSFIPSLFALIAFVFTVRTFLVFKLKDDMQNNEIAKKQVKAMKKDGIVSQDFDYFEELKKLDKLFHCSLMWFVTSILLSLMTRVLIAFFDKILIENAIYGALGIACCFSTTAIVIIAGKIINNIVRSTHLEDK